MKTSKDGISIGETKDGFDITVHRTQHDANGNWCYLVDYWPRTRKISIQHGAACHRKLPVNLDEFVENTASSKIVSEDIVDYINKYVIKNL